MTKEQAIELLLKAVTLAQGKGVFTLGDARVLADAVDVLTPKPETPSQLPAEPQANEPLPSEPAS